MTLSILVLIAIIVVALTHVVGLDRSAARSHFEQIRAESFARMGEDQVIARLQKYTGDPAIAWVSQPGQLAAGPLGNAPTTIPLHSGLGTGSDPNLNVATFREPASQLITGPTPASLQLRWVYVREDGTEDKNDPPDMTNALNPLVGRFAFWADDDSSKVNYNVAWTKDSANTAEPGDPTRVELDVMFPSLNPIEARSTAHAIHSFLTSDAFQTLDRPFFQTPFEARRVSESVADALKANPFSLTHYSQSPDTTYFNQPKIVLTTQESLAGGRPFLDILNIPNSDPGLTTSINKAKLSHVIDQWLIPYLSRSDWPVAPGESFQKKYYNNDKGRLTQLAINIIDYVRSKESQETVVEPLRGNRTSATAFDLSSSGTYMGISRAPRITERGVWIAPTPSAPGEWPCAIKIEVYVPKNFGLDEVNLRDFFLWLNADPVFANLTSSQYEQRIGNQISGYPRDIGAPADFKVQPGDYATVTRYRTLTSPTRPTSVRLRAALSFRSGTRVDLLPYAICAVASPGVGENDIPSTETDDPRVNMHENDWIAQSTNTFGRKNTSSTLGLPAGSTTPRIDVDISGNITDASLSMPYPKGHAKNPKGMLTSVGELGVISTGGESTVQKGVAWRTLRFQPDSTATLPDWAMLDLFTVPIGVPAPARSMLLPHGTAVAGRINLNGNVTPFSLTRQLSLEALLQGATQSSTQIVDKNQAATLAANIIGREIADVRYKRDTGYLLAGEVAEVTGIADGGESSEYLMRELGNLTTARGNVFSVYTIGQALKQGVGGHLEVLSTSRQHTIIKRIDAGAGASPRIKFRPIYFRNLTP
jgi:hypothetical protein